VWKYLNTLKTRTFDFLEGQRHHYTFPVNNTNEYVFTMVFHAQLAFDWWLTRAALLASRLYFETCKMVV